MSALPETGETLSAEAYRRIDREVAKYPPQQKRSAVLSGLVIAQDELGWLPGWAIEAVASYLGMPPIAAYEVATFYAMFDRACGDAPVVLVNNKRMCSFLSDDRIDQLLEELGRDKSR